MRIRTPNDLGAAIRDRRRELGLDQATLARRIGVTRQWVIAIERGRSRAEVGLVMRALAALDMRLETGGDAPTRGEKSAAVPQIDIDAIVAAACRETR
jgi:HTH-type transcriptional regulator/antitoxin HipB